MNSFQRFWGYIVHHVFKLMLMGISSVMNNIINY